LMGIAAVTILGCFLLASCDEDASDICDDCDTSAEREICEEAVDECDRLDGEARDECLDELRGCNYL
jgi:hypothetical protein